VAFETEKGKLEKERRRREWRRSVLYGFIRSRQLDGTLSSEPSVGVWMSSANRVSDGWGWVSEWRCPGLKKRDPWPPVISSDLDNIAKFNRSFMHYRVRNLDELKRAVWQSAGVLIAIPLHPGWRSPADGVITLPASFPKPTNWHSIHIIGYDDRTQLLAFWNNWGPQWGRKGHGSLPYEYYRRWSADAWAVILAPELMHQKNRKKYLGHEFVLIPGMITNPLGYKSIVISLFHIPSDTRVAWSFATVREDGCFEIEEFFVRPEYQDDLRHFSSLAAETFRMPMYWKIPVRYWISYADIYPKGANFPIAQELVRHFNMTVKPSGVSWAPFRADMEPIAALPDGIGAAWPNAMELRSSKRS
jgi:hypothetical protein